MTEPADADLMVRVRQGDQIAFGMLVRRHVDALYNYAHRLSRQSGLADDLVQETWLAAWLNANTFNPRKAKVTTWLHRILHNKFIDAERKSRILLDQATVADAIDAYNAEDIASSHQTTVLLNKLIEVLPQNQKAAIVLTHNQGFSNHEVAQIMGLRVRAVESLLARARRALKTAYIQHTTNTSLSFDSVDSAGSR